MKTVEFTRKHLYGGVPFEKGDKLECPADRAEALVKAGVAKAPKPPKEKVEG